MTKRDIGAIGENVFLSWCEPEGFRAQKSQVDRLGWDFLLEREPERASTRPLDAQNDLPKFLIQVKSSERIGSPPRIKLSALKHLVDTDMPAAILALFFTKTGRSPTRSLLVPVDDDLIADTLRRVRHAEARGNRAIHKIDIPVPLDRAVDLGTSGEGLGETLTRMLGGDASEYVAAKIKHRRTCGYDDRTVFGRCYVPGLDPAKKVSELFLGGPRTLEVSNLAIERQRFGIALDNDRDHFERAILEMDAPPFMMTTIEIASDTDEWISAEAGLFVPPPFNGNVPSPVRVANDNLEVIVDLELLTASFTFNYDGNRKVSLEEAVSIVEIGAILARPSKTLTVRGKGGKLRLPFELEEGPFHRWIHAAPVLRRIFSAVVRSGRAPKRGIVLANFYAWIDTHSEFLALASTPGANMIFGRWDDDSLVDHQDVMLAPYSLEFCGAQYAALIEIPIQSAARDEKEITIVGGQPHVVAEVVRAPGAEIDDFIEAAIETSKRARRKVGPALVTGGFQNWQDVVFSP